MSNLSHLAPALLPWQAQHGRHHLPWQVPDPYHVWLSEIMLQQTQVATVVGYFARFLDRFPRVEDLANAPLEEVLALWSGLGYYARARHLHRAARIICSDWAGQFPPNARSLQTLPGVGRSTAHAIAAFCYQERVAILDANVKRVLSRYTAFEQDLAQKKHETALWEIATAALPSAPQDMPAYTQGLMDLGATVCLTRKPLCTQCPLAPHCLAKQTGEPERYPVKTRKLVRKDVALHLLLAIDTKRQHILLQQRPPRGIWASLFTPPSFESQDRLQCFANAHWPHSTLEPLASITHQLTHRNLTLYPARLTLPPQATLEPLSTPNDTPAPQWFSLAQAHNLGLPAPIRKCMASWVI